MRFRFQVYKHSPYAIPTLAVLIGLILIILNWLLIAIVGLVFGLIFVSSGITLAVNSFRRSRYDVFPKLNFIFSIVLVFLGLACFFNPNSIIGFISHITGLIILSIAINNMLKAYNFMKYNKFAIFDFIQASIGLVIALILIFNPVASAQFTLLVLGIYLLYWGISYAINIHKFQ